MSGWHIIMVTAFFGIGWELSAWYRDYAKHCSRPKALRLAHDAVLAVMLAPPVAIIGLALLSNTPLLARVF